MIVFQSSTLLQTLLLLKVLKRKIMELLKNKAMFILIQMANSRHFLYSAELYKAERLNIQKEKWILTGR